MEAPWVDVDAYLVSHLFPEDHDLEATLAASARAGLPPIRVAPNQGRLLQLLVQLREARAVLEIGTLGGYSTIGWPVGSLPAGAWSAWR